MELCKKICAVKKCLLVERNVKRPRWKRQDRSHDDVTYKSILEKETKWENDLDDGTLLTIAIRRGSDYFPR